MSGGNTSTRTYVEQFLASKQVTIRPEFELATSDMLIQFAVRNLGIASVVRNFAEEHLAEEICLNCGSWRRYRRVRSALSQMSGFRCPPLRLR